MPSPLELSLKSKVSLFAMSRYQREAPPSLKTLFVDSTSCPSLLATEGSAMNVNMIACLCVDMGHVEFLSKLFLKRNSRL